MNLLEQNLADIQKKLKNQEYPNEQSISQGVVLRILNVLKWDTYDTNIVIPEYSLSGRRVDFALCYPSNKPKIFVEVKQQGKIQGADEQLFQYAFHKGVPFAIVTDGREWHFYLPTEVGSYEERRVYKLDLLSREISESSFRFDRYLNFENIKDGSAFDNARLDYKDVSKIRESKINIPIAWQNLVEEKDEILLDLISEKVESLCGFQPEQKRILDFLKDLGKNNTQIKSHKPNLEHSTKKINNEKDLEKKFEQPPDNSNQKRKPHKKNKNRDKIRVVFPDGIEIFNENVTETFIETIKKIGSDRVQSLNIITYKNPLINREPIGQYDWENVGNGLFVQKHSNTKEKFHHLKNINEKLGLGLKIELFSPSEKESRKLVRA